MNLSRKGKVLLFCFPHHFKKLFCMNRCRVMLICYHLTSLSLCQEKLNRFSVLALDLLILFCTEMFGQTDPETWGLFVSFLIVRLYPLSYPLWLRSALHRRKKQQTLTVKVKRFSIFIYQSLLKKAETCYLWAEVILYKVEDCLHLQFYTTGAVWWNYWIEGLNKSCL